MTMSTEYIKFSKREGSLRYLFTIILVVNVDCYILFTLNFVTVTFY